MPIEVLGQRWIEDQAISWHQWIAGAVFALSGAISIGIGTWWDKVKAPSQDPLAESLDALAHDARIWLAAAAAVVFGVPVALWLVSPPNVPAVSSATLPTSPTQDMKTQLEAVNHNLIWAQ